MALGGDERQTSSPRWVAVAGSASVQPVRDPARLIVRANPGPWL